MGKQRQTENIGDGSGRYGAVGSHRAAECPRCNARVNKVVTGYEAGPIGWMMPLFRLDNPDGKEHWCRKRR